MARQISLQTLAGLFAAVALLGGTANAQFSRNTAAIPSGSTFNGSASENIDFGDVDLDGDWDAIFADGGDFFDDQDRIWINQGGLQGGTLGAFVDETSTRFPSILQGGRDIEFVDLDLDGDLDIYTSNTSEHSNQSNRWWINQGGLQGGTLGFYSDDMSRWVNVGSGSSSVANPLVLPSGGFVDWSCDCDFGDLDNDGDLDLMHSSYGGAFGGNAPSRIFLNDGAGFFEEFNPSGFQLSGTDISNGSPALWSEGTQQAGTFNTNGTNSDVASSALDIDLGDTDGDQDLDILHGARQEEPRMFQNRFEENGGTLGFRDITNAAFPSGYTSGSGHYEQEMADLDNDDDLDIYGLNWKSVFDDTTMRNTGNGTYDSVTTLSGSQADDNEGDFLDYDNDGDLDLFVCNFSGQEKLYRNNYSGSNFSFTKVFIIPNDSTRSLDADCADVDGDGKTDIFVANDNFQPNWYLHNDNGTADSIAARVVNLEKAPDRSAGATPTVVRVSVYDNAPYYITWYNTVVLKYQVNGGSVVSVPMMSSGGQIFRAEIPGNLVGNICYSVESTDEQGNVGTSGSECYNASGGCTGSVASFCTAKTGLVCGVPSISSSGTPSATAGSGFTVSASPARSCRSGILVYNQAQGTALPFQGGTLCVEIMGLRRAGSTNSMGTPGNNCDGSFSIDMNEFAVSNWVVPNCDGTPAPIGPNNSAGFLTNPGTTVFCQFWGRDSQGTGSFVSDGLSYAICP